MKKYISHFSAKYCLISKKYYICFNQQRITYEKSKKIIKIRFKDNYRGKCSRMS
ncbi:hypothetical protein EMIT036CA2_11178 [Chryseobacterium sp. IT-36CA2]